MSDRSTIKLKAAAPARDPHRRPVRGSSAPRPKPAPAGSAPAGPAKPAPKARPQPAPKARPQAAPKAPPKAPPKAAPIAPPKPPATPAEPHPEGIRLSKWLTEQGQASRREADEWIEAGWVTVDGQTAVLGQRILPGQQVVVDAAAHAQQARRVTILLHKPIGYVSGQAEDGYQPASVLVTAANRWSEDDPRLPFQPGHGRGLAPAGRLDIDSTGLLVLTQDGRVAKRLIGDDSPVEKEYLVRVQTLDGGPLSIEGLRRLNHGLQLDGKPLRPAKVSWANEDQLRFVLREGRKRQIRRMCELVGLKVLALKRVRIGSVALGKLPPGQWRYLRADESF